MARETESIAPRTWVAIDIAKGTNVDLVEQFAGRQQRFLFSHQRDIPREESRDSETVPQFGGTGSPHHVVVLQQNPFTSSRSLRSEPYW